ncbi:MAG: MFS transporter [Gammaproteobacteria bacterium]|nr:MFS transporter [Gammaproteobacteria bacterium]
MLSKIKNLWNRPEMLLFLLAAAMPLSFKVWQSLLNNFAIEQANFTGVEIGILQSLREIPGFLSFAVIFILWVMREQSLLLLSLIVLGVGTLLTGFFPSVTGLYFTTVLMSIGFHYYEAVNQSLSLQWFDKSNAAYNMGRMIAIGSFTSLIAFAAVYVSLSWFEFQMRTVYLLGGGATVLIGVFCWLKFPQFPQEVEQRRHLFLRKRYWLYYALTFMAGARRQIFVVFAGFLMVEKFGFDASAIAILFLANGALNMYFAPLIGRYIVRWGERRALTLEYTGLILVFVAYAFVENPWIAVGLYLIDHVLFSMAIAIKTYFQKIADPADMAPTAGIAFTINHIAAVILPAAYGVLWIYSPSAVFLTGAGLSFCSLLLSRMIPDHPMEGAETIWPGAPVAVADGKGAS